MEKELNEVIEALEEFVEKNQKKMDDFRKELDEILNGDKEYFIVAIQKDDSSEFPKAVVGGCIYSSEKIATVLYELMENLPEIGRAYKKLEIESKKDNCTGDWKCGRCGHEQQED